jgi:hypothetical protein
VAALHYSFIFTTAMQHKEKVMNGNQNLHMFMPFLNRRILLPKNVHILYILSLKFLLKYKGKIMFSSILDYLYQLLTLCAALCYEILAPISDTIVQHKMGRMKETKKKFTYAFKD